MSALMLSPKHISAIVAAVDLLKYARWNWARIDSRFEHLPFPQEISSIFPTIASVCIDGLDARGSFYALVLANAKSVDYRYRSKSASAAIAGYEPVSFSWPQVPASLLAAFRAIESLDYQSCETPNWEESFTAKWLARLQKALIQAHPDFEAAGWFIE